MIFPNSILNEMIKTSQLYLLESLQKIFNAVLSTGVYPKIWAKGYIVPIFKNGSKDDPSNYRGITVEGNNTKCVGKKRFNGSVTHRLRKEHVLRSPLSFWKRLDHICNSSPMIHCGNRSFLI
jgi:hypothetical protein